MNVSLISPEAMELASRIAGRKLAEKDITLQVLFLVNLIHELSTAENMWNNKRKLEGLNRPNIIEEVGELSGLRVKISKLAKSFKKTVNNEVSESWELWLTSLQNTLKKQWSGQTKIETKNTKAREKMVKTYSRSLTKKLAEELENWLNEVINRHLAPVDRALNIISSNISLLPENKDTRFGSTIIAAVNEINSHADVREYWKNKSVEAHKSEFDLMNFASDLWGNVTGVSVPGITKVFPFSNKQEQEELSIKEVVFEVCWETFVNSKSQLMNQIEEFTVLIVDAKIKPTKMVIDQTILLYCEMLEIQELYQQETPERQEAEKTWIIETRQQLEQIKNQLEAMLNEASSS